MEKEASSITPEESIRIISEMILKTKEEYRSNSFYFLLWGYIIASACIIHFILIKMMVMGGYHSYISLVSALLWSVTVVTGIIVQYIYIARRVKTLKVKSYVSDFMSVNWQVNGALIILAGLFCWKYQIHPSPFILAIAAAATFISGIIIKHNAFIIGSLFLLAFSITTLWVANEYQLLITAFAIILGYILPGYRLKNIKK